MKTINKKLIVVLILTFLTAFCFCATLFYGFADLTGDEQYNKYDIFDGDNLQYQDNFVYPDNFLTTSLVGESHSGVKITTTTGQIKFDYKAPIDFFGAKSDEPFIEFYSLYGDNYSLMSELTITLTDVADTNNSISIYAYVHPSNRAVYSRINYAGFSRGVGSESGNKGKVYESQYGAHLSSCFGFGVINQNGLSSQSVLPVSFSFDSEEKAFYETYNSHIDVILDLDKTEHVGIGKEWKGFSTDRAYMSVSATFEKIGGAGIVVRSIAGNMLEGKFKEDFSDLPKPDIRFLLDDQYLAQMPVGGVGVKYKIPETYSADYYFGVAREVNIEVWKDYNTQNSLNCSADIENGYFIPSSSGNYTIVCTAQNPKKSNQNTIDIIIVDELRPILIALKEQAEIPIIYSNFKIPSTYVFGGSGVLEKEETLYYNGEQVQLTDNRLIFVDKAGCITLKVEAQGYTGEKVVKYFDFEIPDMLVLSVNGMPNALRVGEQIILPEPICYDSETNEKINVKITVDGVELSSDRKYVLSNYKQQVQVKYVAQSTKYGNKEKVYDIKVLGSGSANLKPSDFLLETSGSFEKVDTTQGIELYTTTNNSQVQWAMPVVTGNGSIRCSLTLTNIKNHNDYNYIDVVFQDFYQPDISIFIRLYKDCDVYGKTYAQLNGEGEKVLINGTLTDENSSASLAVDFGKGGIIDESTNLVGLSINSFTAKVSNVSIRFGGVYGNAGIKLYKISNQLMGYTKTTWCLSSAPVIVYDESMISSKCVAGTNVKLANAQAYDMLYNMSSVSVSVVYDQNAAGEILPTEEKIFVVDSVFAVSKLGRYKVVYTAINSNNKYTRNYFFYTTKDDKTPVLTISDNLEGKVFKLGSTLTIPKASAMDNDSGECKVFCYLSYVHDMSIISVKTNQKVVLDKTGYYELCYYTHDDYYNYTRYTMRFKVEK